MKMKNTDFCFEDSVFPVVLVALVIFIAGVQIGIKHGRTLELEDLRIDYGYCFPN